MCASDQTGTATGELLIENEQVKVWRWSFNAKGDNTGWHRHEHDYVVIPLFDGVLDIDVGEAEPVMAEREAMVGGEDNDRIWRGGGNPPHSLINQRGALANW